MRQVVPQPLRSQFFVSRDRKRQTRNFPFLFRQSPKLNSLSLLTFTGVLLIVGGLSSKVCLAAGLSVFLVLMFLYFHTRASAHNLFVERKIKTKKCMEGDNVVVDLFIINSSLATSTCFHVIDRFTASLNEETEITFPQGLRAKTKIKKTYNKVCDGGCGAKVIGPTLILVTDCFGIFTFEVREDNSEILEVVPKIESLPELEVQGSKTSGLYGRYEVSERGHSVKFRGIREFVEGDSLQHIAWRISAKHNEIMVKEFDRMVNSDIIVAVNSHPTLHIGQKSMSTWEMTRDVSLSLISQQLEMGNSVRYMSNEWSYDLSDSQNSFEALAIQLANQDIFNTPFDHFDPNLAQSHFTDLFRSVEPGMSLFYITPYVDAIQDPLLKVMKSLRLSHVKIFIVFIDVQSFIDEFNHKIDFSEKIFFPVANKLFSTMEELQVRDIEVSLLQASVPMSESFLHLKEGA